MMREPPAMMFWDTKDRNGDEAFDTITGTWEAIPCTDLAIASFL